MRIGIIGVNSSARRCLLALLALLSMSTSWAQNAAVPEPPPVAEPEAPVVSAAREKLKVKEALKTQSQVRIFRGEDGTLRIHARDGSGKNANIELDLGEAFGGAITERIYQKLKHKGILDDKGLVIEDVMSEVPENITIDIESEHRHSSGHQVKSHESNDKDWLIPIVAILAVFGTPIFIVWLVTRSSYRQKQLEMDKINRLVAEGRDLPPELLNSIEGAHPGNAKDRGFTLIAVGLAVFIWLTLSSGVDAGSLGLIPLFIGVARFINWKVDTQQSS